MNSFIEFQAIVMDKLCSIESRLDEIENVLGIKPQKEDKSDCENENTDFSENKSGNNSLIGEFNDFHNELVNIKALFTSSEN